MPAQQQMRYTRRLEAFRKLSEAVAHDVNNLLSGILGYTELLLMESPADEMRPSIDEISSAGKRIASLICVLSAFGNNYVYHPEIINLNEAISGVERFLPRILGKEIEFARIATAGLWPVKADFVKMKQAIIMLAVEMKDLMPAGGKLSIAAQNVLKEEDSTSGSEFAPGRYVLVTATSSGKISTEEVARSFLYCPSPSSNQAEETVCEFQNMRDLVNIASGHLVLNICSDQELSVSIYLPAADLRARLPGAP